MKKHYWRLPEGVDEVLPPDALYLEERRRKLIDLFVSWGYSLVIPPLVEYLDALMVGAGQDLDLQTIKFVDQSTGRMLGMRADMTSQVARIDAHSLKTREPQRLCYAGTVLKANPQGVSASRNPIMLGAEIFGCADAAADAEVISLMAQALNSLGVQDVVVELGDIAIYRALVNALDLEADVEAELFTAIQMKSSARIGQLLEDASGKSKGKTAVKECLLALPDMMGGEEVFSLPALAAAELPALDAALNELQDLAKLVNANNADINLRFDLGELTGYGYHTGVVFTAYAAAHGQPLARGGRYDGIGKSFGETRSATGFDIDLKTLPKDAAESSSNRIWVASSATKNTAHLAALHKEVGVLRASKQVVVFALEDNEAPLAECDTELVLEQGHWIIKPIEKHS